MTIKLTKVVYKGEKRILLSYPYSATLNELAKKLNGAQWSHRLKCFHVADDEQTMNTILIQFKGIASFDTKDIHEEIIQDPVSKKSKSGHPPKKTQLPEEVRNKIHQFTYWMRSRRYSENTIEAYRDALIIFLHFYVHKPLAGIDNDDIIQFNNEYLLAKGYSASFQNQVVNAVKLFFQKIENTKINTENISRPKREKKLPNVLSKEEVKSILVSPKNLKHKSMLSLIYSCGLRRSELLNLKIADVDSNRKLLLIKQGKGKKDRIIPLSEKIIGLLREYYRAYKPKQWLFEGQKEGIKYSEKSLESVLKQALIQTNIKKPVSLHWLRHSYATHLLENGTDLRYIQEILGHSSSKTTEIYTHVSTKSIQKIKSPFDDLDL